MNSPYLRTILGLLALKSLLGAGPDNQKNRSSQLPSFIGVAEVRSFLPGRMRLHIPSLRRNPKQCDYLGENLARVQSISRFEVNPVCGSVLIFYDAGAVDPRILLGAVIKLLGLEQEAENPRSRIGKEIGVFIKSLNGALIEKTGGLLDLDSALLLLFVGVGSYKTFIRKTGGPGGITYLWWATSLLNR
jgi:hypothetical protein